MKNITQFIQTLDRYVPVSLLLKERLVQITKTAIYRKGEIIQRAGRRADRMYFLKSGIVKWTIDQGDTTLITWFSLPDTVLYQPQVFTAQGVSHETLEAMHDCVVLYLGWQDLQQLYIDFKETLTLERMMMQEMQERMKEHTVMVVHPVKLERVKYLVEKFPGLIYRMDRESLAFFLGMSASTFRRLKAKLRITGVI